MYSDEYTQIPAINLNYPEIVVINDEIYNFYKNGDDESNFYRISYEYYVNGDIVSIIIKCDIGYEQAETYKAYNINKNLIKVISNEELIKISGIDYNSMAYEAYKNKFFELFDKSLNSDDAYEPYLQTMTSSNFERKDIPMFLDENGDLNVVGGIFNIAGKKGFSNHIINLENYEKYDRKPPERKNVVEDTENVVEDTNNAIILTQLDENLKEIKYNSEVYLLVEKYINDQFTSSVVGIMYESEIFSNNPNNFYVTAYFYNYDNNGENSPWRFEIEYKDGKFGIVNVIKL